jgi:hypothetical protein
MKRSDVQIRRVISFYRRGALTALLSALALTLSGCGTGGYAGGELTSLSSNTVTIDAGQSFHVNATTQGTLPVSWTLAGTACSGAACGAVEQPTGMSNTYTAPAAVDAAVKVDMKAVISGTSNGGKTVAITVNPAPVINGDTPDGIVGAAYSATLTPSRGTGKLTMSFVSGTLPAGLTFDPASGKITGTPTASGTASFRVQAVDQSDVPFTVSVLRSITVQDAAPLLPGLPSTPALSITAGSPVNGTVGVPYTYTLAASGGKSPYTWTKLSGSLPAGLTLLPNGNIAGLPTVAGTSTFVAQVQDANGEAVSATMHITISPVNLGLLISVLPNGTVGVPYSATIGVGGGTAPYTCALVSGTLPAGLTLNANCAVTGTPTVAGLSAVVVRATDSGNPGQVVTGTMAITITPANLGLLISVLPNGTVGVPYSATIGVGGGTAPYTCALVSGTLPAGLTLNANCSVNGTPTVAGLSAVVVRATDSGNPAQVVTGPMAITISPANLALSLSVLPNGTVGVPYAATVGVGGGTAPYTCALVSGTMPAGLTLNANCSVSGTPTAAGISLLNVRATDSANPAQVTTGVVSLTVVPATLGLSISVLPNGVVTHPYNATIAVGGGTAPYACSLTGGTMPAGLTLNSNCTVTGTPTVVTTSVLTVHATDSGSPAQSTTGVVSISILPINLGISISVLPNGTVGVPYAATIAADGGIGPYTCSLVGGTLQAGLTLNSNCSVSGTPTAAGIAALNVRVTDSESPAQTTTGIVGLTISPATLGLSISVLPGGTVGVPYSATIGVGGGTAPFTCTLTGGTVPAGLTLNSNCSVTGTPTAATIAALTVHVTDSGSPAQSTTGVVALTIAPASLSLSISVLPSGTVNVPYTANIGVGGGTAPYSCVLTGGTMPAGLTLNNNCSVTGTPTAATIAALTVKVTDSGSPAQITTGVVGLTIAPAALSISVSVLPNGTVNTPYNATVGVGGGVAPYSCTLVSGTLQAGLTLNNNCSITGTPTAAGIAALVVKATDSASPAQQTTATVALTVVPSALNFSVTVLPNATVNSPYSAMLSLTGGTAPYSCSLVSGTMPTGLTLNSNCSITGTPTQIIAASALVIKGIDSSSPAQQTTTTVALTVLPINLGIGISVLPNGTVGTPYSATVAVAGGVGPYTCQLVGGTMPAGLTLNSNCSVTGTPTAPAISALVIKATDSQSPAQNITATVALTVTPAPLNLLVSVLPNGVVGTAYSATITGNGGVAPYTCSLVGGTMPAGLTLNSNCSVTGTPTATAIAALNVKLTDSASPAVNTTGIVALTVTPASLNLSISLLPNGVVGTAYSATITGNGGVAPYTCSLVGGTMPAGLTLNSNCSVTGTPTATAIAALNVKLTDSASPAVNTTGIVALTVTPAALNLSISVLPNGVVGTAYSATITGNGGVAPYTCSLVGGTMPAGLTLNSNCSVTGTPTATAIAALNVKLTDSASPAVNTTGIVALTVTPAALNLSISVLPNGVVGTAYSATITGNGGVAPYTCSLVGGTMPAGLTLNSNCSVTGTPTAPSIAALNVKLTDSDSPAVNTTGIVALTVTPASLNLSISVLPNGVVGTAYSATITGNGGVAPYTCALVGGTMPAGLTLNNNCSVTGTPTAKAIAALNVKLTDSDSPAANTTGIVALTVTPAALNFSVSVLPNATMNSPYSASLALSGGTAPYTCSLQSGVMPNGLTLNSNCSITGTPTQIIAASALVIHATDSASTAQTTTTTTALTVLPVPLGISVSVLTGGTVGVPYSATVAVGGGIAPYTCQIVGGTMPAGLTLGSNCSITGTPTAPAIAALSIKATDSDSPAQNTTSVVALTIAPTPISLLVSVLPTGIEGAAYSATITASGGVPPYACSLNSGTMPTGLVLGADCTVSGTPTMSGLSALNVKVTDSATPTLNTTGIVALAIAPPLNFTVSVLPNGVVNTPYSASLSLSGGAAPYNCSLSSGVVPTGLTLNNNCTITGTPTQIVTAAALVIHATDSSNPAQSTNTTAVLTVLPFNPSIGISVLPTGTVGVAYSSTIPVTGGVAPYTCSLTGGIMPAGMTLNSDCSVTGTPTTPAIAGLVIRATDSNSPAQSTTATVLFTVLPAVSALTVTAPADATINTAYTGAIGVTGGTAPYICAVGAGTLPAGLTLNNNCSLTGTPTETGAYTLTILASDAASTPLTGYGILVVNVKPATPLAFTGTLNATTLNNAFNQTLAATGGIAPYTYALTSGSLPAGMNLSTGGVLSGTPTAPGATSFTVSAMDSEGTPDTVNLPLVMMVNYPATASDTLMNGHYAFLFQGYDDVAAGVLAYQTATVGSFTADGTGKVAGGMLDRNSQLSTPTGTTVDHDSFLGTYTVGTDGRGSIAVTALNADGTTADTSILAIALKPAVAPATTSAEGSLIAFDGDGLTATKGSGSLLLQDTTAMAAGLNGSYAFGLSGDTPCLPTCSIGIVAGPVATVGQFTASSSIVSGTGDANIGNVNYPSAVLSGNYLAADANGRVQLSMNNTLLAGTPYPTDYAVYVVDANRAFVMSTDKHSDYILQAGTATLQTVSNFTAAGHLNAPFVGYENGPVNPGLVGTVLNNTLNLGSASVFQAQGNANGTCTTNKVDMGGLTGLVSALTGFGSSNAILDAVLGTYQSTGTANCAVTSNGRAVLNYPAPSGLLATTLSLLGLGGQPPAPRVAYLTGANTGYFLETGYATLGHMEAQSGPFTLATLNGTYVYASSPASSLATINASGSFTADGAGNATQTLDRNIGVGTINVLGLGVTGSTTYTLPNAAYGRYLLGTSRVIYAITPGRYILLETDPTSTSPYTAVLY